MLELKEIKRFYDVSLHPQERFLLKEYLQYKILEIVFSSKHASKMVFIGGTCLRIVYLLSLNVKPDFAFLEQKQGITNGTQL